MTGGVVEGAVLSALVGTVAGGVMSSMFAPDKPPSPKAPPPMPTPDDEQSRRVKQATVARMRKRSGRASTIMSEGYGETVG